MDTLDEKKNKEIIEIIQSSHINFLIGSGLSTPFLPLLGDIEDRLTKEKKKEERIKIQKEYFKNVMLPNVDILNDNISEVDKDKYVKTYNSYKQFFELISSILLKRKSTILSKEVNVFTTNIDIFMEKVLEDSGIEYNDGFNGRLNPVYSLSNFKKIVRKKSLHFDNSAEIPVFNIMKIHGSLTWGKLDDKIIFSRFNNINDSLLKKEVTEFENEYKKIVIVNPEKKKLEETVMDLTFYELLRMFSGELEKENVLLFIMGFSLDDEHIREITLRAADSNPTLKIYIFCHSKDVEAKMKLKTNYGKLRYSNIELIVPENEEDANKYDLGRINSKIFEKIVKNMKNDERN